MNLSQINTIASLYQSVFTDFKQHNVIFSGLKIILYNKYGKDTLKFNKTETTFSADFRLMDINVNEVIRLGVELSKEWMQMHFIKNTKDENIGRHTLSLICKCQNDDYTSFLELFKFSYNLREKLK